MVLLKTWPDTGCCMGGWADGGQLHYGPLLRGGPGGAPAVESGCDASGWSHQWIGARTMWLGAT